jgi:hypothetical protein
MRKDGEIEFLFLRKKYEPFLERSLDLPSILLALCCGSTAGAESQPGI